MKTNYFINSVKALLFGALLLTASSCEKDIPVESLSLDRQEATVAIGATVSLLPVIDPLDATNKNVTWSTSDATVATVNNGIITGVALGTATITATSTENTTVSRRVFRNRSTLNRTGHNCLR